MSLQASATPPPPVLEVHDLAKQYGATTSIDGVTFTVSPGEVFGLLGPNGAGKTTTLEIIEGLRQPDRGEVRLFQEAGTAQKRATKERVGVQLQSSALYPHLTVAEVLDLFARFYTGSTAPDELIALLDLEEKRNAPTRTLSGGQQQRLSLALALVGKPELLFLDEPTTGMDPRARRGVWEVIARLRTAGTAVVLTTHYMEEAEVLCDRVAVINDGGIIAAGTVDEMIAAHFPHQYVQFERLSDVDDVVLAGLPSVARAMFEDNHVRLQTTDVIATLRGLLDVAGRSGQAPGNLAVRRPTLEDLFLALTGRALTGNQSA